MRRREKHEASGIWDGASTEEVAIGDWSFCGYVLVAGHRPRLVSAALCAKRGGNRQGCPGLRAAVPYPPHGHCMGAKTPHPANFACGSGLPRRGCITRQIDKRGTFPRGAVCPSSSPARSAGDKSTSLTSRPAPPADAPYAISNSSLNPRTPAPQVFTCHNGSTQVTTRKSAHFQTQNSCAARRTGQSKRGTWFCSKETKNGCALTVCPGCSLAPL